LTDGKLASERFEGELDSAAYQRMAAESQAEFVEQMRALIDAAHSLAVAIVQPMTLPLPAGSWLKESTRFPAVVGASLGVGAEYGRGALRVAGRTEATTAPPQDRRASRRAPATLKRKVRGILACLKNGNYTTDIVDAMLLYARALDEWNQNTAFTMLWSAVERLASPGRGDYDVCFVVVRSSGRSQSTWHERSSACANIETGTCTPVQRWQLQFLQIAWRSESVRRSSDVPRSPKEDASPLV